MRCCAICAMQTPGRCREREGHRDTEREREGHRDTEREGGRERGTQRHRERAGAGAREMRWREVKRSEVR